MYHVLWRHIHYGPVTWHDAERALELFYPGGEIIAA